MATSGTTLASSYSAVPWANTIAADRHGTALYEDASVVSDVAIGASIPALQNRD